MRCDEVREVLPEYSVGALKGLKARRVRKHLRRCPSCARELEALERAASLIESMPLEHPPQRVWESIKASIEAEAPVEAEPARPKWFVKLAPALGALAVIAASLVIYFLALRTETEVGTMVELEFQQHLLASWESPLSDPASLMIYLEEGAE